MASQNEGSPSDDDMTATAEPNPSPEDRGITAEPRYERAHTRWAPDPEQIWQVARILSGAILLVWLIAWPIGTTLANRETTGIWNIGFGYSGAVVILALSNAALVLAGGYLLRAALRLEATADRLGDAVRGIEPHFRSDGLRTDVAALGGEVDRALERLARVEQQIRKQVGLIDAASEAIRHSASQTTDRLARERQALIDATSAMNGQAEEFAKVLSSPQSTSSPELTARLENLEAMAKDSGEQFASLREALAEQAELLRRAPQETADRAAAASKDAQAALIEEGEKLRALIEKQKERADSLGKTLAAQNDRLTQKRESVEKSVGGSWRRILDRVEKNGREDQEPAAKPQPSRAPQAQPTPTGTEEEARIRELHKITRSIKIALFGEPSRTEAERYAAGEWHLFVQQILARDDIELRARLRAGIERDQAFADLAETYLSTFDQLLAPIMNSDPEASEASLQDMLRAPLGKLYVLIGTAKGHFS
jgi:hypothetical protein